MKVIFGYWIHVTPNDLIVYIGQYDPYLGSCDFALYRKGMPQAVKSIRGIRVVVMQKGNRMEVEWKGWTISTNFFCMNIWLNYNKT